MPAYEGRPANHKQAQFKTSVVRSRTNHIMGKILVSFCSIFAGSWRHGWYTGCDAVSTNDTRFFTNIDQNKTENAFSPLPARSKASNADMTACLPLQDCIVQTTRLAAYGRKFLPPRWSPDIKATGLSYGRIILPPRCMHTRAATWELPGCSAVAGSLTAYIGCPIKFPV
jgi:hypothetical protein